MKTFHLQVDFVIERFHQRILVASEKNLFLPRE